MGRWLVLIGALIILAGIAWQYAPWLINWFGRLPGDIRIEKGNTKVFIPITSMLLLSVALSLLVQIARRVF